MSKKKIISYISIMSVTFVLIAMAFAGDPQPGDADPSTAKSVHFMVPTSGEAISSLSGRVQAKQLASHVGGSDSASLYGFTTGISEEKGSFKLGVLLTDVNVTMAANEKEKALKAVNSLVQGLISLGAPDELIRSFMNIHAAMVNIKDVRVMAGTIVPATRPFIEKFIKDEGKLEYLQLGEWCQSIKLASSAANTKNIKELQSLLAQANVADYFSDTFARTDAVPEGVKKSLKEIGKYHGKDAANLKAAARIKRQVENIISLMS